MEVLRGITGHSGLVVGPIVHLDRIVDAQYRRVMSPLEEKNTLIRAVEQAKKELLQLEDRSDGGDQDILMFQRMLLEDGGLLREIDDYINAGAGAAAAVERAGQIYAAKLSCMEDEYFSLRSADVLDACHRVVDVLDGRPRKQAVLSEPSILVSESFYPSDILSFGQGMVLGFIAAKGSIRSHAAIIAEGMGIPTMTQVGSGILDYPDGTTVVLDGENHLVVVDPDQDTLREVNRRRQEHKSRQEPDPTLLWPGKTADGTPVAVMANCTCPEDIETALEMGAEGVAILRTESLCQAGSLPQEEQQYYFYISCLAAAEGKPITIRCFDLGLSTLSPGSRVEENPAMGMRGVRMMLGRPGVFENQLCALLRAAAKGDLRVLMPMVTSVKDWKRCLEAVEHAKEKLRRRKVAFNENMQVGVLVEVPNAALECGQIVDAGADFVTIGTNDLVQYVCGADRYDPAMGTYYDPFTDGMKRLFHLILEDVAGRVPVTVTGIAMSEPAMVENCVRAGIRQIGLHAGGVPQIKAFLRGLDLTKEPKEKN